MVNGVVTDVVQGQRHALPYQEPLRTWAGHGTGVLCNLCGMPIRSKDIEYEVELLSPAGNARGLHFHFNCYREWENQEPA